MARKRALEDGVGLVTEADLRLTFRGAVKVFRTLSPKRMEVLGVLRGTGAQTIYALAKRLKRNYSNVFADIGALRKLGLVEKDQAGLVMVPWEAVEIRFPIENERKGRKQ
jgi:predicted transcriptional regulator